MKSLPRVSEEGVTVYDDDTTLAAESISRPLVAVAPILPLLAPSSPRLRYPREAANQENVMSFLMSSGVSRSLSPVRPKVSSTHPRTTGMCPAVTESIDERCEESIFEDKSVSFALDNASPLSELNRSTLAVSPIKPSKRDSFAPRNSILEGVLDGDDSSSVGASSDVSGSLDGNLNIFDSSSYSSETSSSPSDSGSERDRRISTVSSYIVKVRHVSKQIAPMQMNNKSNRDDSVSADETEPSTLDPVRVFERFIAACKVAPLDAERIRHTYYGPTWPRMLI